MLLVCCLQSPLANFDLDQTDSDCINHFTVLSTTGKSLAFRFQRAARPRNKTAEKLTCMLGQKDVEVPDAGEPIIEPAISLSSSR